MEESEEEKDSECEFAARTLAAAAAVHAKPAEAALPAGWDAAWDSLHQRLYYFNLALGLRSWVRPADMEEAEEEETDRDCEGAARTLAATAAVHAKPAEAALPAGWDAAWDSVHQRIYYFNEALGLRSWVRPDGGKSHARPAVGLERSAEAQAAHGQSTPSRPRASGVAQAAHGQSTPSRTRASGVSQADAARVANGAVLSEEYKSPPAAAENGKHDDTMAAYAGAVEDVRIADALGQVDLDCIHLSFGCRSEHHGLDLALHSDVDCKGPARQNAAGSLDVDSLPSVGRSGAAREGSLASTEPDEEPRRLNSPDHSPKLKMASPRAMLGAPVLAAAEPRLEQNTCVAARHGDDVKRAERGHGNDIKGAKGVGSLPAVDQHPQAEDSRIRKGGAEVKAEAVAETADGRTQEGVARKVLDHTEERSEQIFDLKFEHWSKWQGKKEFLSPRATECASEVQELDSPLEVSFAQQSELISCSETPALMSDVARSHQQQQLNPWVRVGAAATCEDGSYEIRVAPLSPQFGSVVAQRSFSSCNGGGERGRRPAAVDFSFNGAASSPILISMPIAAVADAAEAAPVAHILPAPLADATVLHGSADSPRPSSTSLGSAVIGSEGKGSGKAVGSVKGKGAPPPAGKAAGDGKGAPPPSCEAAGKGYGAPPPHSKATGKCKGEPPPPGKAAGKGKGAPPPPAPRGKGGGKVAPRKQEVKPKAPLKKLFWQRICYGEGTSQVTLWERIHKNEVVFDKARLEDLFADEAPLQLPLNSAPASGAAEAPRVRRLFPENRRRKIWFALARMPATDKVFFAVERMRDELLVPENVELLLQNLPDKDEEAAIKSAEPLAENEQWDTPEHFIVGLVAIHSLAVRVQAWVFLNSFEASAAIFEAARRDITRACEVLQSSPRIEHLMSLVLYVGNYLNGGTARGRADGFDLSTLAKLATIKAGTKGDRGTLLDYVVQQAEQNHPDTLSLMYTEGMEFEIMRVAKRHRLTDLEDELVALVRQAEAHLVTMETLPGLTHRAAELEGCVVELQALSAAFRQLRTLFARLCAWLGLEGDRPMQTDEFFEMWHGFLVSVKKSYDASQTASRAHGVATASANHSTSVAAQPKIRAATTHDSATARRSRSLSARRDERRATDPAALGSQRRARTPPPAMHRAPPTSVRGLPSCPAVRAHEPLEASDAWSSARLGGS